MEAICFKFTIATNDLAGEAIQRVSRRKDRAVLQYIYTLYKILSGLPPLLPTPEKGEEGSKHWAIISTVFGGILSRYLGFTLYKII